MERYLYNDLLAWKKSCKRRPLVLFGARQVGKTWLLKEFGEKEYTKTAYISFDRDDAACQLMETEKKADKLLLGLSALTGVDITPNNTLLILDEIQECPEALSRMKVFSEDAPTFHIVACGSLLGLALHEGISYPVGKVDEMTLYPMTYGEFLLAMGKPKLEALLNTSEWSIISALNDEYIDLLRQYYYVGGMPAAVMTYVENQGLNSVRKIQKQILFRFFILLPFSVGVNLLFIEYKRKSSRPPSGSGNLFRIQNDYWLFAFWFPSCGNSYPPGR